ncbi:MAG: MBL fold metallo-hydrolase [Bacilli bacterium]|nr:MBL fold metallo-hydrolase [Bacilli bacterium]
MANKKSSNKTNKTTKKAIKTAKKMAKKNPTAFIIIVIVLIILIALGVGGYFVYTKVIAPKKENETSQNVADSEGLDINFLELGNKYTGDSTFIKAGNVDILIDAGSRQNSATAIANFVDQYCKDGVLEYVIATHAHQDHIAGFVGSNSDTGILKHYKVDTLIDFSLTNATSKIYNDYVALREEKLASGDIKHHYTANECVQQTNGAKKIYTLGDGVTMEILDQKFYREETDDENDYSVCTLFTQGNNHYLFTGDLEKKGEASLVALNKLPEVELFKGGHHGSYTANTDTLLSVIKPKTVCICCCAGSDEYTKTPENMFPAQAAVDRIAKYTDKVYVTTVVSDNDKGYQSLNGNINFHCEKGKEYTVTGSNNSVILKDTDWFKNNRTWPSY